MNPTAQRAAPSPDIVTVQNHCARSRCKHANLTIPSQSGTSSGSECPPGPGDFLPVRLAAPSGAAFFQCLAVSPVDATRLLS